MSKPVLGNIEYVIFDMDGLLMYVHAGLTMTDPGSDSERIYTVVTNEILARYGYEMTWEIKQGIMGKVTRDAAQYLYDHFPGLEEQLSIEDYLSERTIKQEALFRQVPPMTGAVNLVRHLYDAGVPIALATGSNYANLLLKTSHLPEIFDLFPPANILTADSPEVKPGRGKPQPDIFLAAAHSLGRDVGTAHSCTEAQRAERAKGLVFEDAVPGVKAGVAAHMNVVWVPDEQLRALAPHEDYGSAQVLRSLEEWDPTQWGLKAYLS
ncbi:HAD-like domain-containing protein [Papiliotrema laurentii]|uniref:HAD-like domain-containing protein n=1 Tax=Papiliotrema laurentii TaxID=5418 RepID=A0AAD9D1B4_PAPLA|nr:HAD-like domain-containing protein [Papiliotrema laurentii]